MKSPLNADPDARRATIAELVKITGWSKATLCRAIREGKVPGCIYLAPAEHGQYGVYLCAFKPFKRWWFDGVATSPVEPDATPRLLRTIALTQTIERLLDGELDPTG